MERAEQQSKKSRSGLASAKRRFVASITIPLLLYEMLGIFVLGWAFILMFFDYSPGRVGGPILGLGGSNPFIWVDNFKEMIRGSSVQANLFRVSLRNTLIFALLILPLNLAITLTLAWLLESIGRRFKVFYRTIYFMPVLTASVGVALIWMSMYDPQAGWINAIIRATGWDTRVLAIGPARRVCRCLSGNVGGHPGVPVAGLRLQHGYFHRRAAGHPGGDQGCSLDRWRQPMASLYQGDAAAHPPHLPVRVCDDHAFFVSGLRYHPGDDQRRPKQPDAGADARHLQERLPLPEYGLGGSRILCPVPDHHGRNHLPDARFAHGLGVLI